jgi:hypothetical protein
MIKVCSLREFEFGIAQPKKRERRETPTPPAPGRDGKRKMQMAAFSSLVLSVVLQVWKNMRRRYIQFLLPPPPTVESLSEKWPGCPGGISFDYTLAHIFMLFECV